MSNEEEGEESSAMATRPNESQVSTPSSLPMSEIQLRIARENPRDEFKIAERLSKELAIHAEFAEEGFYSIPYKDKRKGIITFVEGVSIRGAEHMWTRWGNCTTAARIADDRGRKIMVQGMFFDYETGLLNLADLEVSKFGMARGGGTYPLAADKLRLAVQSGESKVKRNAFLGGVPVWIKQRYLDTCRSLILIQPAGKEKPVKERIEAAKAHFTSRHRVKTEDVQDFIAKVNNAYPGLTDEDLLRYLIGLNNAIKDGNAELDFVFGEEREQAAMPQEKKATKEATTNGKTKSTVTQKATVGADAPGDAQEPAE